MIAASAPGVVHGLQKGLHFALRQEAQQRPGKALQGNGQDPLGLGEQFGPGGNTWLRFNFATPRPILTEALDRLDTAGVLDLVATLNPDYQEVLALRIVAEVEIASTNGAVTR